MQCVYTLGLVSRHRGRGGKDLFFVGGDVRERASGSAARLAWRGAGPGPLHHDRHYRLGPPLGGPLGCPPGPLGPGHRDNQLSV